MKKLSEINEGMFSGMVRRANSDQIKKEDANMSCDEFCKYLQKIYTISNNRSNGIYIHDNEQQVLKWIMIPIFKMMSPIYINYRKSTEEFDSVEIVFELCSFDPELKEMILTKYDVYENDDRYFIYKLNSSEIIKLIDFIIENTNKKSYLIISKK